MAVYFTHTCGTCQTRVVDSGKRPAKYVHVSDRYGGMAADHDVTTVVSTRTEEQAA